jgi:vancomycin permeability regulator SanA
LVGIALSLAVIGDLLWTLAKFPSYTRERVFSAGDLPRRGNAALVLGAGVFASGEPTPVLETRLETALELYQTGKIRWFIVSGDNRTQYYNEPLAMQRWLQKRGVPPSRIVRDHAGRRTYDSLRRAQVVFGLHRLVIVTSDFHLPRALFLATHLGIDARGVPASTRETSFFAQLGFWSREYTARHLALLDAWFPPDPILGPREATPEDWMGDDADQGGPPDRTQPGKEAQP